MNKLSGWIKAAVVGLAFIALSFSLITVSVTDTLASGGPAFKSGTIAAKGLVLGDSGKPIWAEFDAEGEVVRQIGEAHDDLANAFVMPASTYRTYAAAFQEIEQLHSAHRRILLHDKYLSTTFELADGTVIEPPQLKNNTWSVVVRTKEVMYDRSIELILHESPLDLNRLEEIPESARAVLLGKDRRVITTADVNIGYRAAFYTPEGGQDDPTGTQGKDSLGGYQRGEDTLWGPIADAKIETSMGRQSTVSDKNGNYVVSYYIPPCPGFYFDYTNNVFVELRYQHFDPKRRSPFGSWYEWRQGYDYCMGYSEGFFPTTLGGLATKMSLMGIEASMTQPINRVDFSIDVAMLTGQAIMRNEPRAGISIDKDVSGDIPLGDATKYTYTLPDFSATQPANLDLNADGKPDTIDSRTDDEGKIWIDVWFGDSDPEEDEPDLTRLADYQPDLSDQGLLQKISKEDLENTDFYVYRVSNGQLVTSRKGLRPDESNPYYGGEAGTETESLVNYRMLMRGPASFNITRTISFEDWVSRTNVNEELQSRKADHLRVGEQVKVVMINRATGYLGSAIGTFGENLGSGLISFSPGGIAMRPPNLKIKAERRYEIDAGLTEAEKREYLIGFEGSGLTSDQYIMITTEWYDWDGSPLPEDLPGLTGRVAKVVEKDVLGQGQPTGRIVNFNIGPGRHIQWLKFPKDDVDTAHYYIHVSGEPIEGNPNFSSKVFDATGAAGEGALQYRPDHFVPIKAPIFDEQATQIRKEPVYRWVYRPEMQFSLLDLKVDEIKRIDLDETEHDLLDDPVLDFSDQQVNLLYTLLEDELPMLEQFGPEREIVFSLGEHEVLAEIAENKTAKLSKIAHLALLEPEDFIAIRLYQHGDDENVLWEYAFETIIVKNDEDEKESVEEIKYSNDGKPKKLYHIELSLLMKHQSAEELRGKIRILNKKGETIEPMADYFPAEYNLTFEEKESKDGYLAKIKIGDNDIRDKFILTNLSKDLFDDQGSENLPNFAKLYGGMGNKLEIEVNGRKRQLPIEPIGVIVLAIDGLRQDVLYPSWLDAVNDGGTYQVDIEELDGIKQILAGHDQADKYKKYVMLPEVTAIFPSITLASWASIFTGKMPNATGIMGNEFFARDLMNKQIQLKDRTINGVPGRFQKQKGMISFGNAAFKGYDSFPKRDLVLGSDFFVPYQGNWKNPVDPARTPQNHPDILTTDTIFETVSEIPEVSKYFQDTGGDRVVAASQHYARGSYWLTFDIELAFEWFGADSSETMDEGSWDKFNDYLNGRYETLFNKRNDVPFSALTVWYLPGLDHEAHIRGLSVYKDYFKNTTDKYIEKVVEKLKDLDEFDNKIFILVSDHGHTEMPDSDQMTFTQTKRDENGNVVGQKVWHGDVSGELKLKGFNKKQVLYPELANNNLHIWEFAEALRALNVIKTDLSYRVFAPSEIAKLFLSSPAGAKESLNSANVIAAFNGPMAHLYLKGQSGWEDQPAIDELRKFAEVLRLLYMTENPLEAQDALGIDKVAYYNLREHKIARLQYSVDKILIREGEEYLEFIRHEPGGYVVNPISFGSEYVDAVNRIDGLNHFDRSGDIILIMKDKINHAVINRFSTGTSNRSWHGSLNPADSYVPLILAYPGGNLNELRTIIEETDGCSVLKGCDGNWRATDLIKKIIDRQYVTERK